MTTRAPAVRIPVARPRPGPKAKPSRPPLSLVLPSPSRAPRAPFVICVAALLSLGLMCLLLLNTVLAQGAFTVHDLQRRTAALTDEQQQLQTGVSLEGSPLVLAEKARRLGLVQVRDPAFIRTSDGKVLGHPTVAKRPYVAPLAPAKTTPSMPAKTTAPTVKTANTTNTTKPTTPTPRRTP
ncbi:MAG: hypothetical protein QOJ92_1750 [Frankiales bacterium]|nr:hypothetical protein [Frankiales bacterium]